MKKLNLVKGTLFFVLSLFAVSMYGQQINAHQWLEQNTLPVFKPGHTLPKLGQMLYDGDLSNDTRTIRARHYGYGVRLSRLPKQRANEERFAKLCATNPKLYKVSMYFSNMDNVPNRPEYNWPEGSFLPGTKIFSPEMPDAAFDNIIDFIMKMLDVQLGDLSSETVACIENWTEYGIHTPASFVHLDDKYPFLVKAKGNRTWREYISIRKGYYEKRMKAAIKARFPNALYTCYATAGLEEPKDSLYTFNFKHMIDGQDLASPEIYYNYFNTGFAGKADMLTELTNARYEEIKYNSPNYYGWLSAGYVREISQYQGAVDQGVYSPMDKWMGFLKINYTAGMLGGITTGEFDKVDFEKRFAANNPPEWVEQMSVLGHAHALFSWLEPVLRNSDLLDGPFKHKWNPTQPAYEFTQNNSKVMVRKTKGKNQWLVTAWAMDGVERNVKVNIPVLGEYTILARKCGTVFLVDKTATGVSSVWYDENGMFPSLTASQLNGKYIQATNITVDEYSPIKVGSSKQLTVKFYPENTTNKSVVWTSSNPEVATVSPAGLVTRHKEGSADITATEQEMGYQAIFQLTVPVKEIALDITSKEISGVANLQLKYNIQPVNATNNTVTWVSENPDVAKVSNTGLVSTLKAGVATIRAISDDYGKLSATCKIEVNELAVKSMKFNNSFLEVGKSIVIRPMFTPGNVLDKRVKWSGSSNPGIMTLTSDSVSCKVTGVSVGEATVSASSLAGGFNASATIKVVPVPPAMSYLRKPQAGTENNISGYVGYQFTVKSDDDVSLFALGRFTNGVLKDSHKVQLWSVSDQKLVASVTITPGSAFNDLGYQYESLTKPVILHTGKSYRIVSQEMAGGDTWKKLGAFSETMAMAKIDFGVTGNNNDSEFPAAIAPEAKPLHGYGGATIFATRNNRVIGIKLNKTKSTLEVGKSEQLEANILIQSALHGASWSTSNPAIGTVSPSGLVTRVAPGHFAITAKSYDGFIATCDYE